VYTKSTKRIHSKCVSLSAGNKITKYLVSKEISTLTLCGNTKAEAWNTLSRRPRLTVEVSWAAHRRLSLYNENGVRYSKNRASVVNGFTAVCSLVRFLATDQQNITHTLRSEAAVITYLVKLTFVQPGKYLIFSTWLMNKYESYLNRKDKVAK
jgi:hypothetical protein